MRFLHDEKYKNEEILIAALASTKDYRDILAGIEIDINYRIPGEIIDRAFLRLQKMINVSFQLLEQHSIHLLLRGPDWDTKAKAIYNEAQEMKSKYRSFSQDWRLKAYFMYENRQNQKS